MEASISAPHSCNGSSLFLSLPEDLLAIVSRWLQPWNIFNLSMTCSALSHLASSEKLWLTQCDLLDLISRREIFQWRRCVSSYTALCRFLIRVRSMLGIWVHQNPELGNVVCVMPGFMSIVGCRILPQELSPLGIEHTNLLWSPVFEIIGRKDGSAIFFLHGRVSEEDYLYPGSLTEVDTNCNILLLEVLPTGHSSHLSTVIPFGRLAFGDRRKMLDIVTGNVRLKPPASADSPLFPSSAEDGDYHLLSLRRALLLDIVEEHGLRPSGGFSDEISKNLCTVSNGDMIQFPRKKTIGGYFRNGIKHILGKSSIGGGNQKKEGCSTNCTRQARLRQFLDSGDVVRLTMRASTATLSSYRAWPNMHDNRFALYKLALARAEPGREFAGLWGGAFGWPWGKDGAGDGTGKALFFLALSYEESSMGQKLLIATKILEGTHYVLHPNGSAMFVANVDEPALDASLLVDISFPLGNSSSIDVKQAFAGEGIANGYGFRYPGSKPGLLYVMGNELLAFVWKETRAVLTLQRINLIDLLRRGERVPSLPPIPNFSYLTKSYSNVFLCSSK